MCDATDAISPERIEQAMRSGEMTVHFQPVVDAATRRPVKLEALARWSHPQRGQVPPAEFVPVAERSPGAMKRFTFWIIEQTLRLLKDLRGGGPAPAYAVNVSAVNLADLDFPDRAAELVRACRVRPHEVTLEITESAATSDPTATLDILTRLRLKGFGLSLDDFGTGYSSLVALHHMPFSEIKVDRSFVAELHRSREAAAIIKTVADLARNMDLVSVAEGVETEEQAVRLGELGVRLLQGYHFSRPLPADALKAWLES
jgi:EAL domain-containing protein (putative c-di-GMP-specific phosphodiesterase class I)